VPDTVRTRVRVHVPRISLLSVLREHPAEISLAVFTLVTGLASFVLGLMARNMAGAAPIIHQAATVTGIASLAVGLYAQMVSATRPERVVIVTGIVAAFVGFSLGLAHGGFAA
jgi:hypothetical protein